MYVNLIVPPVVGALIGWFTNWVAIKLLFRPLAPMTVFGYRIQGLIPKRRKEIAHSIATTIEKELLCSEDFASILNGIDWKSEVEKSVEEVVEHRFGSSRIAALPVVSLVADNLKYHVKYILTRDILAQVEKKKGAFASKVTDNVDLKGLMADRMDRLDVRKFEALLNDFIAKELKHLEWLGGVMGFIIGLVQSLYMYLFRAYSF